MWLKATGNTSGLHDEKLTQLVAGHKLGEDGANGNDAGIDEKRCGGGWRGGEKHALKKSHESQLQ